MSGPVTVALLNDFDIVVNGLAEMLSPFEDIAVVDMSVGNVHIDRHVNVALYDTFGRRGMPWTQLDEVVANARADRLVVFTFTFVDEVVTEALERGVSGYLWKGTSAEQLAESIRRVAAGEIIVDHAPYPVMRTGGYRWPFAEYGLSARESEVLALMTEGLTNPAIAESLYVSRETVKSHVKQVLKKLGVSSRIEAATMAISDRSFARQLRQMDQLDDRQDAVGGAR